MAVSRIATKKTRVRQRRLAAGLAAITLVLTASACQETPSDQASERSPGSASEQPPGRSAGDAAPPSAEPVDPCKLLTEAEVTPVIGPNDGGTGGGARPEGGQCVWENSDTYHSITVSIGAAGTAASGQLSAESAYGRTEPGPDGIRFAPGNIAEFVAGDRACEIQVVTSVTSNLDRPTAIRLIGLVRERI